MREYKNEIICDLAETYKIYDYHYFKPSYVYILIDGLRDDSRFKLKLNNMKVDTQTMLNAITCDYLAKLWWAKTEDAERGTNKPVSILQSLLDIDTSKHNSEGFDSVEEFNKARRNLLEGGD